MHPQLVREISPPERRCGYQCDPVMDLRCAPRSAESGAACSDIRAWDRSRIHRDTPALPFCHFVIKAQKPKHSHYPNEINTLGDHLRARRLTLGLTQKQMAQQLRIDETTVHNWETNHT